MIADSVQIHPKVSKEVFDRLEQVRTAQGHSRGDIVDAALRAYLWPEDESTKVPVALPAQRAKRRSNASGEV